MMIIIQNGFIYILFAQKSSTFYKLYLIYKKIQSTKFADCIN